MTAVEFLAPELLVMSLEYFALTLGLHSGLKAVKKVFETGLT